MKGIIYFADGSEYTLTNAKELLDRWRLWGANPTSVGEHQIFVFEDEHKNLFAFKYKDILRIITEQ
jgi:hypothetical protein